jgi:GTP-binding protein LepA
VSRSLAACEGALLVVDAVQGIEAQTLANTYLALDHNLTIIPVINKIDLPGADPDRIKRQIEDVIGISAADAVLCSAKTGEGVPDVLEALVNRVPAPQGDDDKPLEALVFDSHYDSYRGVVAYIRVVNGTITPGTDILMMQENRRFHVDEVGVFTPSPKIVPTLPAGTVGYLTANMKEVRDCRVGDTVTSALTPAPEPLPGYRPAQSMVFCGLYPVDTVEFESLRDALEKLQLNDAALFYEPETSEALGFGFRCGFLGLLHMDIVRERLEREYNQELITTAPNTRYEVELSDGTITYIDNPAALPDESRVGALREPFVKGSIITPTEFVGTIMDLCRERRGTFGTMEYLDPTRVLLSYELPMAEILYDFFDQLKSRTRGYGSLDYEFCGYRETDLVKMDVLVNGDVVDALSTICHRDRAQRLGRALCQKLLHLIPRQLFDVPIQAAIGGKIIARETVKALRKDVLAKCYGGDVTRKRKLLEKQKEGKKRMKQVGRVEIPQDAFMAILEVDSDDK